MKNDKDAFGLALWEKHSEGCGLEIIERSDGYIDGMLINEYFKPYKEWSDYVKRAVRYVKGRVLDVGCGAGRHALYFQKKGFDVLGIDSSPLAIRVCRERGLKKARVMRIEDVNKFKPDSFDTITMLGHNFGLFGDYKKAKKLLKQMYNITTPEALIIADTRDASKTKNPDHLNYQKLNKKKGRPLGQIRMRILFKNAKTGWFDYLFVSKKEMRDIIRDTGWKIKEICDSRDSDEFAVIMEKVKK